MNKTALVSHAPQQMQSQQKVQQRHLAAVCAVSFALGLLYAFLVRAGLPYDEPAHWNNVAQYARGHFLPQMGMRGVSYEAYQGPFFYFVAAAISRVTGIAGEGFAFGFLRVASLALLIPTTCLCYAIARRVFVKNSHAMALLVAIFIGWNPVLLAISASVQNDSLAIFLSTLVIFLCMKNFEDAAISNAHSSTRFLRDALILGVLTGVAVLCKLTNAYLVVAVPLGFALLRRDENRRFDAAQWLRFTMVFALAVAMTTLWWLLHNRALYGDFTGTAAMKRFFPSGAGEPLDFKKPRNWLEVSRSIVNYWWLNAEYFRNVVKAPAPAKLALILMTSLGVFGWIARQISRRNSALNTEKTDDENSILIAQSRRVSQLLALFYGVCLLVYLRGLATQWFFPARMTLVTIVAPAVFLVGGVSLLRQLRVLEARATRIYGVLLATTLIFINLSMLRKTTQLPPFPFDMKFSAQQFPAHSEELSRLRPKYYAETKPNSALKTARFEYSISFSWR